MSSEKANAGKTVIVTGGSQGIGAGLVRAFLDRGYRIVANSRNISRSNGFTPSDRLALVDGNIAEFATAEKIVEVAKTLIALLRESLPLESNPRQNWVCSATSS